MTVLIDQNKSFRIVPQIAFLFHQTIHVKTLGWTDWNDYDIFMSAVKPIMMLLLRWMKILIN